VTALTIDFLAVRSVLWAGPGGRPRGRRGLRNPAWCWDRPSHARRVADGCHRGVDGCRRGVNGCRRGVVGVTRGIRRLFRWRENLLFLFLRVLCLFFIITTTIIIIALAKGVGRSRSFLLYDQRV